MLCPGGFPETLGDNVWLPSVSSDSVVSGSVLCMWIRDADERLLHKEGVQPGESLHLPLLLIHALCTSDSISLTLSLLDCERRILASGVTSVNGGTQCVVWGHSGDGPGAAKAITNTVVHSLYPNLRQQFRNFN